MIYLLLFYIIFLVAYSIFSLIAIYHLRRFGYVGDATRKAIIIYSSVSFVIILFSLIYIFISNWPAEFTI